MGDTSQTDRPQILVYPPALFAITMLLAAVLEWLQPLGVLPPRGAGLIPLLGLALILISGALAGTAVLAFKRAGTNVNPHSPSLVVVTDGPYRFTRNPMYLGIVVLTLGLALALSLDWAVPAAGLVFALLHYGVVLREEAYLTQKFGAAYTDLLSATRRWL